MWRRVHAACGRAGVPPRGHPDGTSGAEGARGRFWWALAGWGAWLLSGCTPIVVSPDQIAVADMDAPREGEQALNILAIGTADSEGRIVLRSTGAEVARGESIQIGVMGPGMLWGAQFMIVGVDIPVELVRFAVTQGGGIESQPAAVLRIDVPADAEPGLYSILVLRFGRYSIFTGGLEVTG